jgi:Brp/Blh family beta-carotene 15,15'-monooxygenase
LAFGIYFVFWHSIPSILEQSQYIFGSSDSKSFIRYLRNALIYWLFSLLGLFLCYYFLKDFQNLLISVFFSFLAAITFPHTLVIFKIKRN